MVQQMYSWDPTRVFLEDNRGRASKSKLMQLVRDNAIPHVRVGRKLLIRSDALSVLADRQAAEVEAEGAIAS